MRRKNGMDRKHRAGLYLRLSKEDEAQGQSGSISNQRAILERYAQDQGWEVAGCYIDDGYSGLHFDRPGFQRLLSDIEAGLVNLVLTKDLSRLGRDYIDTGYYLERYFPSRQVRYIALADGIDTFASSSAQNDMGPFKSVMNDLYAKDISQKVRAVMDTKREAGQFIGAFAPYGYQKDPENKNRLFVDGPAAEVVRRILRNIWQGKVWRGSRVGSIRRECFLHRVIKRRFNGCPITMRMQCRAFGGRKRSGRYWVTPLMRAILPREKTRNGAIS